MRLLIIISLIVIQLRTYAQGVTLDHYVLDTIYLKDFNAKRVVAYKMNSITYFVAYEDYKKALKVFWKRVQQNKKSLAKSRRNGEYINEDAVKRGEVIDSIYRYLISSIKKNDTVYLVDRFDGSYYLIGQMNNFFPDLMEKGRCSITDENNVKQYAIIRQTGSWYRDPLAAWAGRRYFLPGRKSFFIQATDMIS